MRIFSVSRYRYGKVPKRTAGYVTLLSVLVVGAVGVSLTVSLLLLGLGSSRTGFAVEQSDQAKGLANACAEEALERIREMTTFIGNGGISFGNGECTYAVTSQGAQNRTIVAIGTVGTVVRKVRVLVDTITPTIGIFSWQEVP